MDQSTAHGICQITNQQQQMLLIVIFHHHLALPSTLRISQPPKTSRVIRKSFFYVFYFLTTLHPIRLDTAQTDSTTLHALPLVIQGYGLTCSKAHEGKKEAHTTPLRRNQQQRGQPTIHMANDVANERTQQTMWPVNEYSERQSRRTSSQINVENSER